jgi:hypothetical protein
METKKYDKNSALFICEICDYTTYKKCDMDRHFTTRRHLAHTLETFGDKKVCADFLNYECSQCNYTTTIKYNYDKHLLTEKHKKNLYGKEVTHICSICNKEYMNYRSLWKHKKTCVVKNEPTTQDAHSIIEPLQNTFTPCNNDGSYNSVIPEFFMEVLKESKELQNVLMEQNKELQNKLLELASKQTTNISIHKIITSNSIYNFS